jgi:tetratricopeptide (TPR) repeat protein
MTLSILNSCASTNKYNFQSSPGDASVYYMNGSEKILIGQTPIDFAKTSLPTNTPFTIRFEKEGFDPKEITVTPTTGAQTIVSAPLKLTTTAHPENTTKQIRAIVRKIFEVQELTARQKFMEALATLRKLEDENPEVAEIYAMKGSIYLLLNDKSKAREQWEKALELDPSLDQLRVRIKNLSSGK